MSSTMLDHLSHPKRLLTLNDDNVIGDDAVCYGCTKPVVGFPTYTCSSSNTKSNLSGCERFYLHKSCEELPPQNNRTLMHTQHPLLLVPHLWSGSFCNVCKRKWERFTYRCDSCNFNVCFSCAIAEEDERVIQHIGHDHFLSLIQREALFECDACGEEAKESSYKCNSCEFWIHMSCAYSQATIPTPSYHHHPLHLIFSIPVEHRTFTRYCGVCKKEVQKSYWAYYCHRCTYFVHLKCATISSRYLLLLNEIEGDCTDNDPDLVQLPLPFQESLFDLITHQISKLEIELKGQGSGTSMIQTMINDNNDPPVILQHWSHEDHPLEQLQFSTKSDNDENSNDDDKLVLVCDGCVQPITAAHPIYYACIQCQYFLHSFCANKLPQELPAGASPRFHPQHSLVLRNPKKFCDLVNCGACAFLTNGFYYHCETCGINVELRCTFLPNRIKHKSHKHHTLVQRAVSNRSLCSVSMLHIAQGIEYACQTCSSFQIHIFCAFYPSRMKHRYDPDLPITLRLPPFFCEGVFYCEICEEEVNNQRLLYHCDDSGHSFHFNCLLSYNGVKEGGTIEVNIDNKLHTLKFVLKRKIRKRSLPFTCNVCQVHFRTRYAFECGGCGTLVCSYKCLARKYISDFS